MEKVPFGVDLSPSILFFLIPPFPTQHLNINSSIMNLKNLPGKFRSFGCETVEVDGHNIVNGNHNYIVNGYIVSGLGDNLVLNKTYPRQDVFKNIVKKYNG